MQNFHVFYEFISQREREREKETAKTKYNFSTQGFARANVIF